MPPASRRWTPPALVALALAACASAAPAPAAPTSASPAEAPTPTAPTASAPAAVVEAPAPHAPIFIEDDYDAALADARAHHRPLFVDAWAPWCHSCVSLRAFVLSSPELAPLEQKLTWLSIDTEKPSAEAFLAKFPMHAWPTLWVVDPDGETPWLTWIGTATVDELRTMLGAAVDARSAGEASTGAAASLVLGDRAAAAGKGPQAIDAYTDAVRRSDAATPLGAQARVRLVQALEHAGREDACVEAAAAAWDAVAPGTFRAYLASSAAGCAGARGASARTRATGARWLREIEALARDERAPLLADDRSDLYAELVETREAAGDRAGARAIATSWAAFLEAQAAAATSPAARAVFDYHRVLAYLALGAPERAVPMLEASERDLPDDYDPPARLARVRLAMGDVPGALAAADRALARVYGPRTLRVLDQRADVLLAAHDVAGALATLDDAVRRGEAMHLSGSYARTLDGLRKKRAALAARRPAATR